MQICPFLDAFFNFLVALMISAVFFIPFLEIFMLNILIPSNEIFLLILILKPLSRDYVRRFVNIFIFKKNICWKTSSLKCLTLNMKYISWLNFQYFRRQISSLKFLTPHKKKILWLKCLILFKRFDDTFLY